MVFHHSVQRVTVIGNRTFHHCHQGIAGGKYTCGIGVGVVGQRSAVIRFLRGGSHDGDRCRVRLDHQAVILDDIGHISEVGVIVGEVCRKNTHLVTAHISSSCYAILLCAGVMEVRFGVKAIVDRHQIIAMDTLFIAVVGSLATMLFHCHLDAGQRIDTQSVDYRVAGSYIQNIVLQGVAESIGQLTSISNARCVGDNQCISGRQYKHGVIYNTCTSDILISKLNSIVLVVMSFAIISPSLTQRGNFQRMRHHIDADGTIHHALCDSIIVVSVAKLIVKCIVIRCILIIIGDACRIDDGDCVTSRQLELRAVGC